MRIMRTLATSAAPLLGESEMAALFGLDASFHGAEARDRFRNVLHEAHPSTLHCILDFDREPLPLPSSDDALRRATEQSTRA